VVIAALGFGVALLVGFVLAERNGRAPMMPLALFGSSTFSGVNILTLLLYGALGGAMFFLPFLLIQVHGYSATEAGAVFLPFTALLALLSRWGGKLVDRVGARLALIVGPLIVATGFFLLSIPGSEGTYWKTFLLPMLVLGLGLAVTVAPLTTTVLNSVPQHQAGVASGINNAVAQVASLLLIALLSTLGLIKLNHSLDDHLTASHASAEVRHIADNARKGFVIPAMPSGVPQQTQQAAHTIIAESFTDMARLILLIATGLATASSLSAALMIRSRRPQARQIAT
jgi:MFS family permease